MRTNDNEERISSLLHFVGRKVPLDHLLKELVLTRNDPTKHVAHTVESIVDVLNTNQLSRLSLNNIQLDPSSICSIADNATQLTHLEISRVQHQENTATRHAFVCLAKLVERWRIHPDILHKLVLDGSKFNFLPELVHAATFPMPTDAISIDHFSIFVNSVFLSADGCSWQTWDNALETAPNTQLVPTVKLVLAEKKGKAKNVENPPKIQKKTEESRYKDSKREMHRYMWQDSDFVCKNCNTVWPQYSIIVSRRQTIVSECFKGKKACQNQREFESAQSGDLWISKKHIVGNGGLDLTPKPEIVLQAAANNQLVAIDPTSFQHIFWNK